MIGLNRGGVTAIPWGLQHVPDLLLTEGDLPSTSFIFAVGESFKSVDMFEPPDEYSQTSLDFMSQLRNGNKQAWSEFHRLYASIMLARCLRVGFQYADAEEVVSDFFYRVYTALVLREPWEKGGFERQGPGQRFRYWLRIVFMHTYENLRRELAQLNEKMHDEALIALFREIPAHKRSLAVEDEDVRQALEPFIDLMEEEYGRNGKLDDWRIFLLIEGLNWNSTEVAHELGLKPNTVRVKLKRVLLRFKDRFGIERAEEDCHRKE